MLDPNRTNGTAGAAIFSRIFESSREGSSPELARYILELGFSTEDRARMRELAAKNRRGDISHQELEELDDLSDWNVPSWNELIASLYRPER